MAFRRNNRFSPKRRSFKRRTLNWHKSQKPRRWQMGNFNLIQEILVNSGSTSLGEFSAQLVATPSNFTTNSTGLERQLTQAIRRIEVGGIVWTQRWDPIQTTLTASALNLTVQQLWTINVLDATGFAVGIDYPWGQNSQPVSNVPSTEVENTDEPIRILDRTCGWNWAYTQTVPAGNIVTGGFRTSQRSRSLRLKVPILDNQALCYTVHIHNNGLAYTGAEQVLIRGHCVGTIYYRYVD